MARIYCRLRNVLICVCTPCVVMLLMVLYVSFSLYMMLNESMEKMKNHPLFVAQGSNGNGSYASLPGTFWEKEKAFWNQLQRAVDLSFNPILYPTQAKPESERVYLDYSFLEQSFSKVANMGSMKDKFEMLPEHMQRYSRSMQRRSYPVLIHPHEACGAKARHEEQAPFILFAIKSSELNIKNRQAIRQTWGREGWVQGQKNSTNEEVGGYVRRVFLLGKENSQLSSPDLTELLNAENRRYGDILQWDFEDTFFNLTLKDVLFWSWFSRNCGQTQFVFKGDDDVFVNTPKLISYLHEQLKKPRAYATMKEFMVGDVIGDATPIRTKTSKYFIPDSFYKGIYPSYAGGGGVVYSGQLARRLHHISKTVHLYPIDDVFVGMCMRRLNALPIHHPAFLTFDFTKKEVEKPCSYHTILLVHKRSPEELLSLWAELKRTQTQCRDVPLRALDTKNVL